MFSGAISLEYLNCCISWALRCEGFRVVLPSAVKSASCCGRKRGKQRHWYPPPHHTKKEATLIISMFHSLHHKKNNSLSCSTGGGVLRYVVPKWLLLLGVMLGVVFHCLRSFSFLFGTR